MTIVRTTSAMVVGALVAAALGTVTSIEGRRTTHGPLGDATQSGSRVGVLHLQPNDVIVYRGVVLGNAGSARATVRAVRLFGGGAGVQVGPILAVPMDDSIATIEGPQTAARLRENPSVMPAEGAVVAPGTAAGGGVNLVLTLRFVGTAPVTFRGVRVVYDYEGRTYTHTDATTLQLCPDDCPG